MPHERLGDRLFVLQSELLEEVLTEMVERGEFRIPANPAGRFHWWMGYGVLLTSEARSPCIPVRGGVPLSF